MANANRGRVAKPPATVVLSYPASTDVCPWLASDISGIPQCADGQCLIPFQHYHMDNVVRYLSTHDQGIDCGRPRCPNHKESK